MTGSRQNWEWLAQGSTLSRQRISFLVPEVESKSHIPAICTRNARPGVKNIFSMINVTSAATLVMQSNGPCGLKWISVKVVS